MDVCTHKEGWALKNCFWVVELEKTLESPLESKEIKPVNPKGNQAWIFIGRTDAEAETPIFWPPDEKNWPIRKYADAWKNWVGGEGENRGWDVWMASLTQRTWMWVNSWSLLKLMSIESVMPSNHLILCRPLLLLPSIFPSILFSEQTEAQKV